MKKILLGLMSLIGVTTSAQKPNILILFADDQRADAMGCSGNTYIKTPNIDKLAETGDTAVLKSKSMLPMEYNPAIFKQVPDQFQPEYTLKKYFKSVGQ